MTMSPAVENCCPLLLTPVFFSMEKLRIGASGMFDTWYNAHHFNYMTLSTFPPFVAGSLPKDLLLAGLFRASKAAFGGKECVRN